MCVCVCVCVCKNGCGNFREKLGQLNASEGHFDQNPV